MWRKSYFFEPRQCLDLTLTLGAILQIVRSSSPPKAKLLFASDSLQSEYLVSIPMLHQPHR